MRHGFDDRVYLDHILDYILDARNILADNNRDRLHELALVRVVEVIGEAANNVSKQLKQSNYAVPWRDIIDMRNRLIHGYFEINIERLWQICERDVPELKQAILRIKKELPNAD